jgi:hypothetical protein
MGLKDYESIKKRLIEMEYLDGRYIHPDEIFNAIDKALDDAVLGRAARATPAPVDVAKAFLAETIKTKAGTLSERIHAASLLLGTRP